MKLTLEQAYEKATKGPLKPDGISEHKEFYVSEHGLCVDVAPINGGINAALLSHAFNVLPEVIKSLEDACACICASLDGVPSDTRDAMENDLAVYRAVITKASTVTIPD